jgi:predicted YcjX-like family ATPase
MPVIIAITIAIVSACGGAVYRHEIQLVEQQRDISKLRVRVYRERMRLFEYHERYARAMIQVIDLRGNKEQGLSVVDKTYLNFFKDLKESVGEEKQNYVETYKHEGK